MLIGVSGDSLASLDNRNKYIAAFTFSYLSQTESRCRAGAGQAINRIINACFFGGQALSLNMEGGCTHGGPQGPPSEVPSLLVWAPFEFT
ncbi:unnamed protein product [Boreogadus saida]